MQRLTAYLFGLLIFAVLASDVPAQIYRWVDEKGTVHFSDERPSKQVKVKEVVEAGAQRTPMVRGGPEWRVDTPVPDFYEKSRSRDRDYDEYDNEDYGPRQGDTIIQVYEPPPAWFEPEDQLGQPGRKRERRNDDRRYDDGRQGDGRQGDGRHGDGRQGDGRQGYGDRRRDGGPRVPLALPPLAEQAPPAVAPPRRSSSSRAMPLRR